MDCIAQHVLLPEMQVGDWVLMQDVGAYTTAAQSQFNGFPNATLFYSGGGHPGATAEAAVNAARWQPTPQY